MSEANEQSIPVDEAQTPVGSPDLAVERDALRANNKKLNDELVRKRQQADELQRKLEQSEKQTSKREQDRLLKQEEYQTLWEQAQQTNQTKDQHIAELEEKLRERDQQMEGYQVKVSATQVLREQGALNPDHILKLKADEIKLKDGQLVGIDGGVEMPIDQYVSRLKSESSGYAMYFQGTGARGMSAVGSSSTAAGSKSWSNLSVTERIAMEQADLDNGTDFAARLKAAG